MNIDDLMATTGGVTHANGTLSVQSETALTSVASGNPTPVAANDPGLNSPRRKGINVKSGHLWILLILAAIAAFWYFGRGTTA